jgi:hypothetical protein
MTATKLADLASLLERIALEKVGKSFAVCPFPPSPFHVYGLGVRVGAAMHGVSVRTHHQKIDLSSVLVALWTGAVCTFLALWGAGGNSLSHTRSARASQ